MESLTLAKIMHIIKRLTGFVEPYNERKLYTSVHAACLAVRTPIGEAEVTAAKICEHVLEWLKNRLEVTSLDVRYRTAKHLEIYNPDAAYAYLHHGIIAR
jgi:hypothetical protein